MRRKLIGFGVLALCLAVAVPALARPGSRGGDGAGGRERGERMVKMLDLSAEQATAMKSLRESQKTSHEATRDALQAKRQELRAAWDVDKPSKATIVALTHELNALEAQLATARVDFLFEAQRILTPDQFKKLVKMEGRRGHGKFHGKHGKRGKWGGKGGKRGGDASKTF